MNAAPVSGEWCNSFDPPVTTQQPPAAPPVPRPAPKLSVVLPFIGKEIPRVLSLLDWMAQLSGQLPRTLHLLPFKGLDFSEVRKRAGAAFVDVQVIADSEGVTSDWQQDGKVRDAAGPNSLFRQAAWYFYFQRSLGPWLWLEPDCVPLVKDWLEQLEASYRAQPKPFFGAGMRWPDGDPYLNGAAIYPQNAIALAPALATRTMWTQFPEMQIGFDVAGGKDVFGKACITNLIQLEYRSDEEKELRKGAVLFHGDRAGKLLQHLSGGVESRNAVRAALNLTLPDELREAGDVHSGSSAPPARKSKTQRGRKVSRQVHCLEIAGSIPAAATDLTEKNYEVTAGYPLEPRPHEFSVLDRSPLTVGDEIRAAVGVLVRLATNANRKTRIQSELRKARLVRR